MLQGYIFMDLKLPTVQSRYITMLQGCIFMDHVIFLKQFDGFECEQIINIFSIIFISEAKPSSNCYKTTLENIETVYAQQKLYINGHNFNFPSFPETEKRF